ncbi:MAG: lipopolysaccharide biosynthesis protein [Desulfovibrio sp.]|jgi:O-antigen/teichoic acid export membrane protein|nr:lipopolysaccharide biosynthesis protein [Desulfovibrio sp.]
MSTPTLAPVSLARRYLFKLFANMASVPVYLVMEAILPRVLGPVMYGNYSFATNFFQQLSGFLDMGTSLCFYNALSRRQSETELAGFYTGVGLLVACVTLLASVCMLAPHVGGVLMPGIPLWLTPPAALWAFLTWWGRVLRSMNDALGATVASETARTGISLLSVSVLSALFFSDMLNIYSLFAQQYLMLGVTALAFWHVSRAHWRRRGVPLRFTLTRERRRAYCREFFSYSHPLFVQALLSFVMIAAERWLLQWFEGSAEQGFFALSQKVSIACFLFVSAMTPLVMRELSIAWGHNDREEMGRLLTRLAPPLYVIAAYFSCFTLIEGEALVAFFGGAQFAAAIVPVQIMAMYPLHQTYGQLAGSVFHAAGRTNVTRNVTTLECVYGFATTWFLLAPSELWGIHLGAVGLALKTVCVQFVTVNLYFWLASRFIPLCYWRNLFHQIWSFTLLVGLAFACRECSMFLDIGDDESFVRFLVSGVLYSVCVLGCCAALPALLGFSRQEQRELFIRFIASRGRGAP